MKAILLAAGLGTRLRPLTDTMPKCLVPIAGRPLLYYWLSSLHAAGVNEVLINTHHFAESVTRYLSEASIPAEMCIQVVHEANLLGTAGTVRANRAFVEGEESFLVCYADNFSLVDLNLIRAAHEQHTLLGTIALFTAPDPRQAGIVQVDGHGVIRSFVEKPTEPVGTLANAGIYMFRRGVLDHIPEGEIVDFSYHVFPQLANRLVGVPVYEYHQDIGSPAAYERVQREAPALLARHRAVHLQA